MGIPGASWLAKLAETSKPRIQMRDPTLIYKVGHDGETYPSSVYVRPSTTCTHLRMRLCMDTHTYYTHVNMEEDKEIAQSDFGHL